MLPTKAQAPAASFPRPHPHSLARPAGTTQDVVEVESYDPYTDTWAPVSPALKYVSNFSAAGCQGRLYLVGSSACKYNALALQCYNPVTGGRPGGGAGATAPSARPQGRLSECGGGQGQGAPGPPAGGGVGVRPGPLGS